MPRGSLTGVAIRAFLSDPDLRRWYENTRRGSPITADVYARSLRLFCHFSKTSPAALLAMNEPRLHALMLDFVAAEEQRGQAGSSTATHLKATRSWLAFHGIRLTRPLKVRGVQETPSLAEERTPTQDELRRILLAATPRNRLASALMAFSGVRPEVLGNYSGEDGLRLRDLPELRIRGSTVEFERAPAILIVRPNLSKAGHRYFSFLGEEGCGYLVNYLRQRVEGGEPLQPDSDVIHPEAGHSTRRGIDRFIRTINVGDGIRKAIREAGFPWRPYVLRSYFDTQLLLAESRGKVAHDYRVFWMGHVGSMEARYTTNKGRLPEALIDDMREAYRRCEPFLSTAPSRTERNSHADMAMVMLLGLGYTEEELASVDFADLDMAIFQDLVTRKVVPGGQRQRQQLVETTELPQFLEEGWTVVTTVNGHQVVASPPASP